MQKFIQIFYLIKVLLQDLIIFSKIIIIKIFNKLALLYRHRRIIYFKIEIIMKMIKNIWYKSLIKIIVIFKFVKTKLKFQLRIIKYLI